MADYVLDVLSHSRERAPIGNFVSFVLGFGRFEAPVILKRLLRGHIFLELEQVVLSWWICS
jgi:hypothetical protein